MALLPETTTNIDLDKLRDALQSWYSQHQRDLPWRRNRDPYMIWISEIMLQQTRVETVLPYYSRFCDRYPSISALANADDTELTGLWAGLGYYSRARNLKRAAQMILEKFGGIMPRSTADLESLPGIGKYTAAAIASIAYGDQVAAVDGNLERVLARVLALREEAKGSLAVRKFAANLVALGNAGDLNQGLMDLANKVCRAKNPDCLICPLASFCEARKLGLVNKIPVKAPKREKIELSARGVALIHKSLEGSTEILVVKRPLKTWLAGMWDLPWWVQEPNEAVRSPDLPRLGKSSLNRTITHHKVRFTVEGFLAPSKNISRKELETMVPGVGSEFRWLSVPNALQELPKPSRKSLLAVINGEFVS